MMGMGRMSGSVAVRAVSGNGADEDGLGVRAARPRREASWLPKVKPSCPQQSHRGEDMKNTLYEHQLRSVHALEALEAKDGVFCSDTQNLVLNWTLLADPCGAGKTRTVCALLYNELQRARTDDSVFHSYWQRPTHTASGQSCAVVQCTPTKVNVPITVIISSLSIQGQWSEELSRWNIEHEVVTRRPNLEQKHEFLSRAKVTRGGLVLVMPVTMVKIWAHVLGFSVHRVVYDEPDSAYIAACPSFDACRHVMLVSATFYDDAVRMSRYHSYNRPRHAIQDKLWDFHACIEDVLNTIKVQQSAESVQSALRLPPVQTTRVRFRRAAMMRAVESVLPPHLRAMSQADATNDLIRALGGVVYGDEQSVVQAVTANLRAAVAATEQRLRQAIAAGGSGGAETAARARLGELTGKLHTLQARVRENIREPCPVCMETSDDVCLCPKCSSNFCRNCIVRWLETRQVCPMCRGAAHIESMVFLELDADSAVPPAASAAAAQATSATHGEQDAVPRDDAASQDGAPWQDVVYPSRQLALIAAATKLCAHESRAHGRLISGLVYCAAAGAMSDMCAYLTEAGFRVAKLNGVYTSRMAAVEKLRQGECDFLVVDMNTDAAGMDLPFVQYIVLPYACSTEVYNQAVGRAQRPGRLQPLHVVQLVETE